MFIIRRSNCVIDHLVSSHSVGGLPVRRRTKRTIISQANMFVTLLFICGIDPPAKVYKLGWLKVCYHISVGHEMLVTSSLSHRLYVALIEINLTRPSLFIRHVYKHGYYCLSERVFVCARILSVFIHCKILKEPDI